MTNGRAPGELAEEARARYLARQTKLSCSDFVRLTGLKMGLFGQYTISERGVGIDPLDAEDDRFLRPEQQAVILEMQRQNLRFPCSPVELLRFCISTKGANGVPDISLPPAFVDELERIGGVDEPAAVPLRERVREYASQRAIERPEEAGGPAFKREIAAKAEKMFGITFETALKYLTPIPWKRPSKRGSRRR